MNWGSLSNFLHMGGYALYVWGSYIVFGVFLVAEVALLLKRRRTLAHRLSQMHRLHIKESHETAS
ncbi:MAG: heme exporter protein CcmD [Betaproteobacteria bacterium]|nr:heme exporter protein CcmD [Betaproteobacteria bacterium]